MSTNTATKEASKSEVVKMETKTAAQLRMDHAREAGRRLNDFENNAKFQKWVKVAKPYKLTMTGGKDTLWEVLDTVSAFDLKISTGNFEQYLSFLFLGIQKPLLKVWVREWNLNRSVKVSYVEYLQGLLGSNEIDYLGADDYKASIA